MNNEVKKHTRITKSIEFALCMGNKLFEVPEIRDEGIEFRC